MPLTEPRHLAVLVRLAGAPGRSLPEEELLLCLWPEGTLPEGRAALARAAADVAAGAGRPLLRQHGESWQLDPLVESDLDRAAPRRAADFLRGRSIADGPEWDAWVAEIRRSIGSRPMPARPGRFTARRAAMLLGVIVVLGGAWALWSRRGVGVQPGDRVVLADVDSAPAGAQLAMVIQTVAGVALQESRRIELVPRARALELVRSAGQSASGGLTRELAFLAATRAGAPWVLTIEPGSGSSAVSVTARLLRAATGREAAIATGAAATSADIVEAVDGALRTLERRIGEPEAVLRDRLPLNLATTSSTDALIAYSEGVAAWRRSDFDLAREQWHRAVTLDTGFAMAMGSLGAYYFYTGGRARGETFYREALARRHRLTTLERLRLESGYATARGDLDSALTVDRIMAATFPRADTYYNLGTALLQLGRSEDAIATLRQARRLDSTNPNTAINIATAHKQLRQFDAALRAYREAERLDSTVLYRANLNLEFAGVLVDAGRPAEAETALTRMSRRPDLGDQALGFRGLGYLALWRGQPAVAKSHFTRAVAIARQLQASTSLLRNLALLAAAERAASDGPIGRARGAEIDSVARVPKLAPGFLTFPACLYAADGDPSAVAGLLEWMRQRADPRSREDSAHVWFVTGLLAVVRGAPDSALAAFDRTAGFRFPHLLAFARARALERGGRLDSALALLRQIVATPTFGSENQIAWIAALVRTGELEERIGRPDAAISSYRRLLEVWNEAEPNLPVVARVRARLASLTGEASPERAPPTPGRSRR